MIRLVLVRLKLRKVLRHVEEVVCDVEDGGGAVRVERTVVAITEWKEGAGDVCQLQEEVERSEETCVQGGAMVSSAGSSLRWECFLDWWRDYVGLLSDDDGQVVDALQRLMKRLGALTTPVKITYNCRYHLRVFEGYLLHPMYPT